MVSLRLSVRLSGPAVVGWKFWWSSDVLPLAGSGGGRVEVLVEL